MEEHIDKTEVTSWKLINENWKNWKLKNDANEWKEANDTIEPEQITRSGRASRRPKQYEDYEPF